ncbi:MAG: 50S ribosomal protein L23 [Candidatus Amesbacteria bacterium GW2011_GWA1_47_16]|uniref:Large ribosomal subunit protein uL23 n=6 Tax=Microgenomates group TaxID=1794810 RepID=A0A0H4T2G3_9BACT|nr:50S ribosomal protein L23, large subunit ribosomal protein L23 [uncultured Microgenomates bacterium Rifle_16ft_4_minimus_1180]KKU63244.1 MAG: 50S ribosomal protein L23 [Candidatus Amesbacteria bacterium GW2011_GWC1_47_15]KKU63294.1 MAG: 50S ribosomal protein L23 [Candidatus Amesbacteria bacterium GW2011_GWA1_47_16]KKU96770.1 MAG: 50S ribosomal protein L23 [Candidatus Amesbacteria bacterium GW2011_GWB1_48_13]OGD00131.1 MAG: 50S ribosomal protein L23 [Candidatus Amesbacteria bacterium RIFCSPHI
MLIKRPIITEKTVKLNSVGGGRIYAFEVEKGANKSQIGHEVESLFSVKVARVQTVSMHGKTYRSGKKFKYGRRPDWKKAIVTLKKDQKIELFDVPETAAK